MKPAKFIGVSSTFALWLKLATNALAQTTTPTTGGGATSGALPNAGSTEFTYVLFIVGAILFVIGTLKFILSFKS